MSLAEFENLKFDGVFVIMEKCDNIPGYQNKIIGVYENEEDAKKQMVKPNIKIFGPIPFYKELKFVSPIRPVFEKQKLLGPFEPFEPFQHVRF